MKELDDLIERLDKIAKKNEDEFRYRIDISKTRAGLRYSFGCSETADGHTFTSGVGADIAAAVKDANDSIPEALEQWGYGE